MNLCPKCGSNLVLIKGKKVCENEECNYIELLPNFINKLPSAILFPLLQYYGEENPKMKLWNMCDFIELLLRLIVIIKLAFLKDPSGKLSQKAICIIKNKIERPTFGQWYDMAKQLTGLRVLSNDDSIIDKVSKELFKFIQSDVVNNEDTSIIELRNLLAHGGGITKKIAERKLAIWNSKFINFLNQIDILSEVKIIMKNKTGEYRLLAGDIKDIYIYVPEDTIRQKLEEFVYKANAIYVIDNQKVASLWPLTFYGNPACKGSELTNKEVLQQIFTRREEHGLKYLPIGSEVFSQSDGEDDALLEFIKIFDLGNNQRVSKKFAVRDFSYELNKESNKLYGRTNEVNQVVKTINNNASGIYWIFGNAGIGKSCIMSRVAVEVINNCNKNTIVLPFIFKSGDDRCYWNKFICFSIERLKEWKGIKDKHLLKSANLLTLLNSIAEGYKVIFILDGIDELSSKDLEKIKDIISLYNVDNVIWVCASRENSILKSIFTHENCNYIFENNLPVMSNQDIYGMICEKMGLLRKRIITNDIDKNDLESTNLFIENVTKFSEGLPIYVSYVINDILCNKIMNFDENTNLPKSLYEYHDELLKRCSTGIHNILKPMILALITISFEPMTLEILQDILISDGNYILNDKKSIKYIEESLSDISHMLKCITTIDGKTGYIIHHKKLKEHIYENELMSQPLSLALNAICKLIQIPGSITPKEIYLYKWGVKHLLESNFIDKYQRLTKIFSSIEYLEEKLIYQDLESFIDDFYYSYNAVQESRKQEGIEIVNSLVSLVIKSYLKDNIKLSSSIIQETLIYRPDDSFYKNFLEIITDEKALRNYEDLPQDKINRIRFDFLFNYASLIRRKGKLKNASLILNSCLKLGPEVGIKLDEAAKIEYELAYIYYLKGNPHKALKVFEDSTKHAKESGDNLGYTISNYVMHLIGFITGLISKDKWAIAYEEAYNFYKNPNNNLSGFLIKKWLSSLHKNCFLLAYQEKDLAKASDSYTKIKDDPWLKKYDKDMSLSLARLLILEERYDESLAIFQSKIDTNVNNIKKNKKERLSLDYLEYAKLLSIRGEKSKAVMIANLGLSCPNNCANSYSFDELKEIIAENS